MPHVTLWKHITVNAASYSANIICIVSTGLQDYRALRVFNQHSEQFLATRTSKRNDFQLSRPVKDAFILSVRFISTTIETTVLLTSV